VEQGKAIVVTAPLRFIGPGKLAAVLAWACWRVLLPVSLHAQQDERAVRAAYLFTLTKYVSWPSRQGELKICSKVNASVGTDLKQILDGKVSEGRTVHVVLNPTGVEQRQCAILYLGSVPPAKVVIALRELGNAPVLTVGDDAAFVRRGGMVGLVRTEDQIQLHVNLSALGAAGIQMSSRLLSIAIIDQARRSSR
jgi:hypothetical protein